MIPIKRTDVFQEVINRIDSLVESGVYGSGERLPSERELSETLGVSRTSIRQALKVLESSGKVETRIGSGTYVTGQRHPSPGFLDAGKYKVDKVFLRGLVVARAGVERTIFEECCRIVDQEGISQLRRLIDENAVDFVESELDENGGLDLSFETKVAELVQNPILFNIQQEIHRLWVWAWRQYGYTPEEKKILHVEHIQILEALERRDVQQVTALIVEHVNKNIE